MGLMFLPMTTLGKMWGIFGYTGATYLRYNYLPHLMLRATEISLPFKDLRCKTPKKEKQ